MGISNNVSAKARLKIISDALERFGRLISGHRKMLEAIGSL